MKKYAFIIIFGLVFLLSFSSVSAFELEDPQAPVSDEDVIPTVSQEDESLLEDVPEFEQNEIIDLSPLSDQMALNNHFNEVSLVIDYVKGLLLNMSNDIDYLFFPDTVDGITHYYLFYDLDFDESGNVVLKSYPCIDIYNIDGVFYQSDLVYDLLDLPILAYGSFRPYAALIDKQFHFNDFYVVAIGLMIMFIMFRKRVFT